MAFMDESKKLENEELKDVSGGETIIYYVTCPECKKEMFGGTYSSYASHGWITSRFKCENCGASFSGTVEVNPPKTFVKNEGEFCN